MDGLSLDALRDALVQVVREFERPGEAYAAHIEAAPSASDLCSAFHAYLCSLGSVPLRDQCKIARSLGIAISGALPSVATEQQSPSVALVDGAWEQRNTICDGCGTTPVQGIVLHSKVREDFDLCATCFWKETDPTDYECRFPRIVLAAATVIMELPVLAPSEHRE